MQVKYFFLPFLISCFAEAFWKKQKPFELLLVPVKTEQFDTSAICQHLSHSTHKNCPALSIKIASENETTSADLVISIAFFLNDEDISSFYLFTDHNKKYALQFEQLLTTQREGKVIFLDHLPYKPLQPYGAKEDFGIEIQTSHKQIQTCVHTLQIYIESLP